jgi:hypothetical protein
MIHIKTRVIITVLIIVIVILSVISISSASEYSHKPKIKNKIRNKTNWAGYVVDGKVGSVTYVKGSWIVPAVEPSKQNQYSSFWVGIDGDYMSNTIEQVGTDSSVINGVPTYFAWIEFYPKPIYWIRSMQVNPGDKISAEVKYEQNQFTVSITDVSSGQSFSTSAEVNSAQRNSAEWIAEAPPSGDALPLANFSEAYFGQDYTQIASNIATINGTTGNISSFGTSVDPINMVTNNGVIKAQVSPLSTDGTSFSVSWVSAGP